jgi:hypothetical protein
MPNASSPLVASRLLASLKLQAREWNVQPTFLSLRAWLYQKYYTVGIGHRIKLRSRQRKRLKGISQEGICRIVRLD